MPIAKIVMIVPEMIWSAWTLIESHPWIRLTSIAAMMATTRPMRSGAVIPSGPMTSAGMSWALIEATHQATNAAVSIIPSMPMLMMPSVRS